MDSYKASEQEIFSESSSGESATYSIRQLASEFGITMRAIRFYESKKLILPKKVNGRRTFTELDRARLFLVVQSRKLGLALTDIKEVLDIYYRGEDRRTFYKVATAKFGKHIKNLKHKQKEIDSQLQEMQKICAKLEKQISTNKISLAKALGYPANRVSETTITH